MIRVSIAVCSGSDRFRVAVQAESIQRAIDLVGEEYPSDDLKVCFPLDPDTFFVEDHRCQATVLASHLEEKQTA